MKTHSDTLYQLIERMHPSEKRYFRQHTPPDSDFRRLFDAIQARDPAVDPENIPEFPRQGHQRYALLKAYLYQNILKWLDLYHLPHSDSRGFSRKLHQAEILWEKGFAKEADQILRRIKKQAMEADRLSIVLEILRLQRRFVLQITDPRRQFRALGKLVDEEKAIAEMLRIQLDCMGLHDEISFLYNQVATNMAAPERGEIRTLAGQLNDEKYLASASRTTRVFALNGLFVGSIAIMDLKAALDCAERMHQLMQESKRFLKANFRYFISTQNNRLVALHATGRRAQMADVIDEMADIRKYYRNGKTISAASIFARILHTRTNTLNELGEFEKCLALVEEVHSGLRYFGEMIPPERAAGLRLPLAVAHMGTGKHREALREVHHILRMPEQQMRRSLREACRTLNCVLHYELGNWGLLETLIRNAQRHYTRHPDIPHAHDRLLLDMLDAAIRLPAGTLVVQKHFAAIVPDLEAGASGTVSFGWHPKSWLLHKGTGTPYATLVRAATVALLGEA